ncbi:hypothetical protein [Paenibacillus kobensis]|uniref:hypothetical protein n=1 Tax=Paenibacillus kobensis TaxID=59841 RepID=UPI001FE35C9B|nr:hypothetical protein [Paenibacillus kobensis]
MELGKIISKPSNKTETAAKPAAVSKQPTGVKPLTTAKPAPVHKAETAVMPQITLPAAGEKTEMKHWCKHHMHRYVLARTYNGWCIDGIVEHIDDQFLCLAVPCGVVMVDPRGFVPFGGPFGGPFGSPFGAPFYPYPYYPRRRFIRQTLPLAALVGLSVLPFF